ncbi:Chanoclavine-I aldehyde reductase easA [Lasiodiplodia hormozganensis]|uniref:Chanoclavine-I aldehyde reductase easA n=1 Tax=Lasiodiplodia hormozganensis TaxID=869390 RepID=A0AA39YZF8_9PEZI|nr:Chanoclavine-I aldehyde reductase easA [Lasiodiplodia hormozganensis]
MADSSTKLFQPLRIAGLTTAHRIVMAPLTRLRNTADHTPLPMAVAYYRQRSCYPGTLIIGEACQISARHGGMPHAPGLWAPAHVAAWKEITAAVHAAGCRIVCQLWAPGRAADPAVLEREGGHPFVSASAVPMGEGAPTPREMSEGEIWEAVRDFGAAARRAVEAGFDGVEIHGANGYLVDQFLQDTCNRRTDSWGGSVEGRARFAIEVVKEVVKAVGDADKVGIRLSPWSTFQAMKMEDPVPQFTYLIKALREMGLGYLHVVESRVVNNVDTEKKEGIEFALEAWGKDKPVLVAGGFKADSAKKAVDEEYKDWDVGVVFGRYFLSTPDLVYRLEKGLEPNAYDRSTFYTPMQEKGYLDYPFSESFEKAKVGA